MAPRKQPIFFFCTLFLKVNAVFIDKHPLLDDTIYSREELVKAYFDRGYTNLEIVNALSVGHAIYLSISTIKRLLRRLNLKSRTMNSNLEDVVSAILKEKKDSGSCLGYRSMWKRLKISHGINVKRDVVMTAMKVFDPESVDRRKKHRLIARHYVNPGPNCMWHIDGNDKLKPYGFAIHSTYLMVGSRAVKQKSLYHSFVLSQLPSEVESNTKNYKSRSWDRESGCQLPSNLFSF